MSHRFPPATSSSPATANGSPCPRRNPISSPSARSPAAKTTPFSSTPPSKSPAPRPSPCPPTPPPPCNSAPPSSPTPYASPSAAVPAPSAPPPSLRSSRASISSSRSSWRCACPVPRLLIADDVGIGKTIEAGLILRELIDRGEVDAFSVLCPPHLVEQWVIELQSRFGIDAVAVTAGSAARLERALPVSPDALRRLSLHRRQPRLHQGRETPRRLSPEPARTSSSSMKPIPASAPHQGKQQRFGLLTGLSQRSRTAHDSPHRHAPFRRRGGLRPPAFPHLIPSSRSSASTTAIPRTTRPPFRAAPPHRPHGRRMGRKPHLPQTRNRRVRLPARPEPPIAFHEAVLDYCFGVVARRRRRQRDRRLAFWGTLALMRCVGSSPAAALSALRNRIASETDRLEPQIYDEDGDDEDAVDVEPGASLRRRP